MCWQGCAPSALSICWIWVWYVFEILSTPMIPSPNSRYFRAAYLLYVTSARCVWSCYIYFLCQSVCALVCVSAAIRDRDAEAAMTKQPEWIKRRGDEHSHQPTQVRSGHSQITSHNSDTLNTKQGSLNLELRIPSITKSLGRVGSLPSAQLWRLLSVSSKWKRKTQDPQSTNTLDNWTACWR